MAWRAGVEDKPALEAMVEKEKLEAAGFYEVMI